MQPQYGQPVYVQQQPYPGTYQPQQGGGYYQQQPVMMQPGMGQPVYGQQQFLVETVMIAQDVPQGYPTGQGIGMRYLPNNANGCEFTTRIQCPACQKEVNTLVESKAGGATYGWVAITCFCCFPFCCIPCFVDSCKDKIHKCPFCQAEVGICQKSMC